ncbi:MAG: hypothetical protein ACLPKB_11210 [Xanthobacteraceae bacterium]
MAKIAGILALALAACAGGCVTSIEPLLSDDEPIVSTSIAGLYAYRGLGPDQKLEHLRVRLDNEGKQYKLVQAGEVIAVSLHKFDDQFILAQMKEGKNKYAYWLVYRGNGGYFLINIIPCDPDVLREAGVSETRADSPPIVVCTLQSRDELMAVARLSAKKYLSQGEAIAAAVRTKD